MAVAVDTVALKKYAPVAGTPIAVAIPVFEADNVVVVYGRDEVLLIQNVDYTVTLDSPSNFDTFSITPALSLTAKIAALIAADATEENSITVYRLLDYLTESTEAYSKYSRYVSSQHDKTAARFQQIAQLLGRAWRSRFGQPGGIIDAGADDTVPYYAGGNLVPSPITMTSLIQIAANLEAILGLPDLIEEVLAAIEEVDPGTVLEVAIGGTNLTAATGKPGLQLSSVTALVGRVPWPKSSMTINAAGVITFIGAEDAGDGFTINTEIIIQSSVNITARTAPYMPVIPQQFPGANDDEMFAAWMAYMISHERKGYVPNIGSKYTTTVPIEGQTLNDMEIEIELGVEFDKSAASDTDCILRLGASLQDQSRVTDVGGTLLFLAADTQKGELVFTLSGTPDLAEDDEIGILDTTDYSLIASAFGGRTYDRKGEIRRIKQVSGTSVTITEPLELAYAVSSALYLFKIKRPKVKLTGGYFIGNPAHEFGYGVVTELANVDFEGNGGTQARGGVLHFRNCTGTVWHPDVSDPEPNKTSQDDTEGYGISRIGCDKLIVYAPKLTTDRHADTYTGGGTESYTDPLASPTFLTIPNIGCVTVDPVCSGGFYGTDFHGPNIKCGVKGGTIHGGAQIGGRDTFLQSCKISGLAHISTSSRGKAVQAGTLVSLNFHMDDCDLYLHDMLTNVPEGMLCIDTSSIVEGGHLRITRTRIHGPASNLIAVNIKTGPNVATDYQMDIDITSVNELRAAETETAPLFILDIDPSATGKLIRADIKLKNLAARISGAWDLMRLDAPEALRGGAEGILVNWRPHPRRSVLHIEGAEIQDSTSTGILVQGVDSSDVELTTYADTELFFQGNRSMGNDVVTGDVGYRNSARITGVGIAHVSGNVVGDDKPVPTQSQTWLFDQIGRLFLGDNTILGSPNESFTNIGGVNNGPPFLSGSKTHNFASVSANSAGTSTDVTVTGAAVGDKVRVSLSTAAGLALRGVVTAPDTVTVYPYNPTPGAIDAASGTLLCYVHKD